MVVGSIISRSCPSGGGYHLSVGEDNEYHHRTTVLKQLSDVGARMYRTDQDGRVTATSFPQRIDVKNRRRRLDGSAWRVLSSRQIIRATYGERTVVCSNPTLSNATCSERLTGVLSAKVSRSSP